MGLEKEATGRIFSSFSENLAFLLSCLKTGNGVTKFLFAQLTVDWFLGKNTQRLIFIVEEFDLFCAHHNQTLLYNLFDVSQSAQTPICVLGISSRLDVIELLEKRVKSRFSHRQIFLLPDSENFDERIELFKELLRLPSAQESSSFAKINLNLSKKVSKEFNLPILKRFFDPSAFHFTKKAIKEWNESINQLAKNHKVRSSLENMFEHDLSISSFKIFLFQLISNLSDNHPFIKEKDIVNLAEQLLFDKDKVKLMTGLSVLQICLLIAIKHHCEIYDNDPFNFEMILTRYNKFAYKSSTMQNIDREVVLKGFENLKVCKLKALNKLS